MDENLKNMTINSNLFLKFKFVRSMLHASRYIINYIVRATATHFSRGGKL